MISGTGGLTKDGSGTLTLSGVNTYTGTTTVSAGTLKLGVTNALAAGALDVQSGATFDLNNFAHAVTGLSGAGGISLDSATLTAGSTADTTFSGVISGTGGLTKVGTGTFTLTGANTYSGVTTVNDGVLKIGAAGSVPTGALSVGTDGTFDLNNFAQTVTDLTGAGEITLGSATLTAGSTADTTFSGVISGMGSLVKVGAGMLTLAGVNTYTGYTIVNQGILRIGVAGAQGLGELIIGPDGTVDFNGFDQTVTNLNGSGPLELNDANLTATSTENTTYAGVISGTGSFIKDGTATLALSGNNTYSGGTTVASGTLSVAGSSPTGTGSVTVEPGAVLSGRGTIQGQITVFGTLKPGNSPGYLQTTANVNLKTGSTYLQDIAGAAQANDSSAIGASGYYAYLNIQGGELRIASDTTLTPRLANLFSSGQPGYGSTPYTPLLGDRFRIITADKGIKGRFSELTQPKDLGPGTSLAVFYDIQGSNSVDLSVIPSSYTQTVASGSGNQNAVSVGAALDQISQRNQSATSTQTQDELLSATAAQRSANAIANYAQRLSGEVYAANVAVSAQTTLRLHQTIRSRLGLANPAAGSATVQTGRLGLSMIPATRSLPTQNPDATQRVWASTSYQRGVRGSDDHSGGWNSNLYQVAFGTDIHTSANLRLGGGFGLSNTTLSPTYASSTIQQASLFIYGKMSVEDYIVDAITSIGLGSSDISRRDVTGLSNGFKDSSVYGKNAMFSLGISRPIDLHDIYLTPYGQLTWQGAIQEGINEGDSAAALTVPKFTGSSVRGVLGIATRSKSQDPSVEKYTYGAYIGIGVDSSNLLNPTLTASLAGVDTSITTPTAGHAFVQAGWYGTVKLNTTAFAYLGIAGEARERQTLGSINAGISIQF